MKHQSLLVAMTLALVLSGCASKIESGQLDYDNGIAYKHGSNDPFTGEVHFAENDHAAFIGQARDALTLQSPYSQQLAQRGYACVASFKNGAPEGETRCTYTNGEPALSFTVRDGQLDGKGVRYNTRGDEVYVTHWKRGAYDGVQKVYSLDGDHVIHEWSVEDGRKLGKEYWGNNSGDEIAEGEWGRDGRFTGTMLIRGRYPVYPMLVVVTFKDGVKDGPFRQLDPNDPSLKKAIVTGAYGNDKKEGEWTYRGQEAMSNMGGEDSVPLGRWERIPKADSIQVSRKDGRISGLVKILDKEGDVLLSFHYDDGKVRPPVMRFDPASGKRFSLSDAVTIRAMNNAANVRRTFVPNADCLGPMLRQQAAGGVTYVFNNFCNLDYTRTHLSDLRMAAVNHILDPVKFPDFPTDASILKAEADAQAASTPSHWSALQGPPPITGLNSCVDEWLRSSYQGGWVIATPQQIDQWQQSCSQGKYPSH